MMNFDLIAKEYDTDDRIKRAKVFSDEIRARITDGHKKSALEYGCGTGLVGLNLINDFDSVIFVDSSSVMIEQINKKLLSLGKTSSYALRCDFMSEVPKNLKIDYIFVSLVLHHIEDVKTILSCFYNMLNDDGRLLIIDKNGEGIFYTNHPDYDGYDGFNQTALTVLLKEIGFRSIESKTFWHSSKIANGVFILDAMKRHIK